MTETISAAIDFISNLLQSETFYRYFSALAMPTAILITALLVKKEVWVSLMKETIIKHIDEINQTNIKIGDKLSKLKNQTVPRDLRQLSAETDFHAAWFKSEQARSLTSRGGRELATLGFLFESTLRNVMEAASSLRSDPPETSEDYIMVPVTIRNDQLFGFVDSTLSQLEYLSATSVSFPNDLKIEKLKTIKRNLRKYVRGGTINSIPGLERGPENHPNSALKVQYFFESIIRVFGGKEFIVHNAFCKASRSNYHLLITMLEKGFYAPLSLSDQSRTGIFSLLPKTLYLVSIETWQQDSPIGTTTSKLDLYYSNIAPNFKFAKALSNKDQIQKLFKLDSKIGPAKIIDVRYVGIQTVKVSIEYRHAQARYLFLQLRVRFKLLRESQKGVITSSLISLFDSLAASPKIIYIAIKLHAANFLESRRTNKRKN